MIPSKSGTALVHRQPIPSALKHPLEAHRGAAPLLVVKTHLSTTDPDELLPTYARLYPGATLRPLSGTAFRCDFGATTAGPVSFVAGNWDLGGRVEAAALGDRYALVFGGEGSSGDAEVEIRSRRLSITPGTRALLLVPGRPGNIRLPVGSKGRTLTIEQAALEAHFAMLTGHASRGAIPFDPDLDLTTGGGATLHGIVRLLREEIERPAVSPFVRPHLFDVLLTALVTIPRHDGLRLLELPPPRVAPAVVRRAEEYIAAHAGEAIRLSDIVAATGAPARSLQAAFRASRGMTPMEFLKIRRLEQARQMLLAPQPGTTAAGVAAAMGFRSAGRFSVEYRKHFRESPSETLARGRASVAR
ncbi:AraC family transcriptional regulator [Polyangium mundeleinium]|uniref:AraC family transcriptional regulator n=1 Tax=Polyangium mundeleinium TaxID=2995306 RepID=A0ABT5EWZ9_9BACT|nr:AraC family transcriptional regulator [Polyangium mundeleinium]MDC0745345.1 AraC family transcriptional regulator [Polyangium mundeleinium]